MKCLRDFCPLGSWTRATLAIQPKEKLTNKRIRKLKSRFRIRQNKNKIKLFSLLPSSTPFTELFLTTISLLLCSPLLLYCYRNNFSFEIAYRIVYYHYIRSVGELLETTTKAITIIKAEKGMKSNPNVKRDVHIQEQINLKRKKYHQQKFVGKKVEKVCAREWERESV